MTGKNKRKPLWFRLIGYAAATLVLFVVMVVLLGEWARRSGCVALPNGLLIGHEAVFDPDMYFWDPSVVLKYPDGTTALSDWIEDFYFSKTTAYGRTYNHILGRSHPAYRPDVFFAYRPDAGLVYRHKDSETYERLIAEAGPLIWVMKGWGGRKLHTNLLGTFLELKRDPANRRFFCAQRLLPDRRGQRSGSR